MVTKSAKRVASFLGTSALTRPLLALSAASALLGAGQAQALDANTLPQNPNVVGGKDGFAQSGNTLNVNQSTKRTVIDWRSFDIGSKAQVNFNQPGTSAIAVNRVNSSANATQIEGGLHANGQVWILNPNGVFFGKGAHVDAAGIVASTANIDTNAFMAGSNKLQMTGADHGAVENQGNISVGANGLAAFVAPSVRNSGTINATVGKVALAAGTTYTLDLAGDHLVELGLGSVKAVVDNSGKIVNPGGTIALTAKAAGQVVSSVVNVAGVVSASSVSKSGGTITLGGDNINTTATAQLSADAGTNGDGGSITSVANNQGNYAGSFSAKGGSQSGNGGSVETSGGSANIDNAIKVNTMAAHGATGTWTIDPTDLLIDSSNVGGYESSLGSTNVNLLASNSITLNTAFDTSGQTNSNTLNFKDEDANGHLTVNLNAPITLGASQHLIGDADVVNLVQGALLQNGINVVSTAGGTVNLAAGDYTGGAKITGNDVTLNGAAGARILSLANGVNGVDIFGNNVTVENIEFAGPADQSYQTFAWGNDITRGIVVEQGVTGFAITNNNIHGLRNDILLNGIGNTGSITGNTIDNSKSGISISYTDGTGVDISGNTDGQFGNEWGENLHLNQYWDGTTLHPNPYPGGAAPIGVQNALLADSTANGGWTVQDQAYVSSNRTAVTVSNTGADSKQGSPLNPLATIQAGINAVVAGGTVNVLDGTYVIPSGGANYIEIQKALTLKGQSELGTVIDARNASTYGVRVQADNVSLSNFTVEAPTAAGSYGIKVEPLANIPPTDPNNHLLNFKVAYVTSQGSGKTELDLNGVVGATIDHFTANGAPVGNPTGSTAGNGIALTDSADVTITNSVTENNQWGGLALYQTNTTYTQQTTNITVDGTNTFNEANPIYAEDQSNGISANGHPSVVGGVGLDFGTINLTGFDYEVKSPTDPNDVYTWFQRTQQNAIDFAAAIVPTTGAVEGYASGSVNGNNIFSVGKSTGGTALSIQAAVNAAAADATINVGDGTYTGDVTIAKSGIKLLSENGSGATTIQGVAGTAAEGTIFLTPGSDNTQIGDIGHGFTIVGFDSANPAQENAAVYIQQGNNGSSLIDNHITAQGDEAILTEYNAAVTNLTIDHNLIDGTTFTGPNAASGDQFSVPNVARGLVYVSGGAGVTNTQNIHFTNNTVTGVTGGPNGNSNYLVTIDAVGATIEGNTFAGTVTGTSAQLRTRGTATDISGNTFDDTNLGTNANAVEILNQSFTGASASDDTFAEVMAGNTFNNRSVWLDHSLGGSWYVGTSINNAVGAATAGDTVHVGAGTYSEAVNINKSLTLEGANAGVNAADGTGAAPATRGAETVLSHNGQYAFSVNASDVTIDGFEFTGGNGRLIDWASASNIDGLTVKNNIFNTPSGAASGGMIQLAGTGTANNVEIANNLFEGTGTSALVYVGGTANAFDGLDISGNDFVASADNAVFQAGGEFDGLEVSGNYFGHNLTVGLNMGQLGDPTIEGNTFVGVQQAAMQIGTTSGGTIQHNTIDGTGAGYNSGGVLYADGIDVWGGEYGTGTSSGLVIQYNTIKNFVDTTPLSASDRFAGIYLRPDAGPLTIENNTIENNTIGLLANTATTGSTVDLNTFTNNATHVLDRQGAFDLANLAANNTLDRDVWISGGNALFGNIQTGVNASADGDTVNVGAGTYEEQVVISDSIDLVGAGAGQTVIQAPDLLAHSVDNGYGTQHKAIISVEGGANVNISDLTVDGLGKGDANYAFDGIGFFDAEGTVDNVHITGIRDGGAGGSISGMQDGVGVVGYNTDGYARTITLENSTIDDFQKTGAAFDGGDLTVNVTNNTVTGAGSTGVTAQNGIQFYGIAGTGNGTVTGTIAGNTVSGVSYAPVGNWSSTGILLISADGTTVEGNTVTGAGTGDYSNGIYVSGGTVDVANNTVTNFGWGLDIDNDGGPTYVTVSNNTITGNGVGLEVAYQEGDTSVVNARSNDFSNNASSVELESADATLDATGNYWGTTDDTAILAGMSGADANAVNFSSFLASGTDTSTNAGFQGDFSHLIVTALGGGTDRLGEAVSEVDAGGTINVNAGTYTLPDMLVIDKSLSLVGAGEGATTIDGSGVSSNYAMRVRADDVSLSGFTLEAGANTWGAISVNSQTSNPVHNISISNVTIDDGASGGAGLAITNTNGATLDHVTVDGMGVGGNGIQISDSGNVVLTNVTTQNNQRGLMIFEAGNFAQQTTGISADTTNQFKDPVAVIVADFSAGAPGLGSVNIQGFQYAIGNQNQYGNAPGELINGQQNAIDHAVVLGASDSYIEGWTGTGVDNDFQVGVSTGGTALSINTAVGTANAGGIINVATGTYGEDVSDAKQLAFNFGNVNVNSFTLASGAAGTTLNGNLTATGAIALNGASTVTGNLTAASFASNATLAMTGNIKATGAATFNGPSTITGNVTADSITDSNTLALAGNFAATHGISLGGASAIVGNLSGGSIATTAPLTLIGNATASGAVNLGGTTGVTGNVQGATIATTGPLTLVGDATATGGVTFGGVTSVTGNVKGSSVTANNTLALNGNATASGAITANGTTLLSGKLTGGSIALNGATTLTGNTTLDTSAANGAISTASVDGTTAGGQSLGINAGTGTVSLGNLGATTRLGAVSDASKTTLTGSTYNANSFLFGGDVTLTSANTTLNTTQSASAAGDITFQGDLFGTTDAAQSLTLIAGPGTGAASANGNMTLQNAGTSAVYLGDLTVTGNNFTALTVDVGGNYNALLTGNQVFAADTLNVRGNASSVVGGDASGHIVAGGDVTIAAGGDISGTISGENVNLTGDDVNSVVTANNAANIKGNTVEGSYTANTVTLIASNNVDAAVNATDFVLAANHGSVDGTWTTINTNGSNVVSVNGQTTIGLANINPNQLVVEGFVLPAGTTIGANGQLILPQGVLLGLLSPGGGKPKMILVHSVQQLGELLAGGYSVIVIDLSNRDSGKPIQLASN